MKKHRGILIDKIPVRGLAGLVFAVGVIVIFLIGLPPIRQAARYSLAGGILVAAALYWWRRQTRW